MSLRLPRLSAARLVLGILSLLARSPEARAEDGLDRALQPYALSEQVPAAKAGFYSRSILKFLDVWPPPTLTISDTDREIYTRAIKTPDHTNIIGLVKHFNIQAPMENVAAATERFEDYPKIWEGCLGVQIVSRDRNRIVTDWTRKRPAFFMPKLHYRLLYVIDRSRPDRIVYRQQLMGTPDGNALKTSDGLVVLEKRGEKLTRLSIVNFFDPDAGPFRGLVEGVIWKKTVQNSFKDDVAFRTHVEHPDWDLDKITDESDHAWDKSPIDPILYTDLLKFQ